VARAADAVWVEGELESACSSDGDGEICISTI
jgi:hypothetical protein